MILTKIYEEMGTKKSVAVVIQALCERVEVQIQVCSVPESELCYCSYLLISTTSEIKSQMYKICVDPLLLLTIQYICSVIC